MIGLTADDAGHRTTAGVLGFVIGAMLVSIAWNVHRALDTRARQVGARRRRVLGLDAGTLASASMWIGLVAGLVSAFAVATELAK
ncbi:hypothetical protein Xcel_1380 [Xylanimonas cellulosilytica DSM 15894]|uniref:Uncharacterized protein n=1 Tax=Xylanimonas cellulosilytica (strain DSM 15894 / JCM 12276 / CECT 5975 / KCTC 9989 / LMG 20990 / NBRC 107835 / XIL07) TaxID=446471 RepID=D1BRF6_XYLCX|nr:hypothetical protein [Xylanimonas cellulosilytica]ACZ30411.1 hypothetical protein Xcel_1380 [Xylanimonas cellulosilytica DSM 15894]